MRELNMFARSLQENIDREGVDGKWVAEAVGVSQATISNYLSGRIQPSLEVWHRIRVVFPTIAPSGSPRLAPSNKGGCSIPGLIRSAETIAHQAESLRARYAHKRAVAAGRTT